MTLSLSSRLRAGVCVQSDTERERKGEKGRGARVGLPEGLKISDLPAVVSFLFGLPALPRFLLLFGIQKSKFVEHE